MIATLLAVLLLAWLAATAFSLAHLYVLRPLRLDAGVSRLERAVFALPLGMGMLAYLVLLLGLLREARPAAFGVVVGLGLVVTAAALVQRAARRRFSPPLAPRPPLPIAGAGQERQLLALAASIALGLIGLLTFVAALAPPGVMDWDALSYHLADPKTYLMHGRIFYLPWDHHSNFPFTLEMLYLLMLGLGSVGAAKLCHWLCGALIVASVITFARRHLEPEATGRRVGWIAALIVAGTPIVLWEASIAYADLATALFSWLSLYALVNAASLARDALTLGSSDALTPFPSPADGRGVPGASPSDASRQPVADSVAGTPLPRTGEGKGVRAPGGDSRSWLIISALLMGFALGTKMTVLAFWGMLLLGILGWHVVTKGRWARQTIPHALLWGGIALLVGLPWYVKSYLYTGSPVYPFFYNLFGGRYWNAANAAGYAADQARFGLGKTPVDLLLAPWQATMEPLTAAAAGRPFVFTEYQPFILSPALLALALAAPLLLGARRLSRPSVCLALFAGGVFVFWFFLMQQTRYLIPAVPALAIVGAEALVTAWEERRRVVALLGGVLIAASLAWAVYLEGTFLTAPAIPYALGQETAADYIAHHGPDRLGVAMQWVNANTPDTAKVALFDEVRGYYLDRPYLWATPNHAYGLLPWDTYHGVDDWLTDFKRRGYTTLLVNEKNAPAQDDGQRWRTLLTEAASQGKVTLAFQVPNGRRSDGAGGEELTYVKVYRIP